MKKFAVIVAGGSGSRMGGQVPKQFLTIHNKPLLYYSVQAFLNAYNDLKVILVLPEAHTGRGQEIIDAFFNYERIQLCIGGETRFHSVKNGLQCVNEESIVFVHDAVRCMVTPQLIQRCYEAAVAEGSAIPVIDCKDSLRIVHKNGNEAIDRSKVKIVQTPQVFHSRILLPAFNIDYKEKFTDEASVVEAFGMGVHLVPGDELNIKVTHPADLDMAARFISKS